MPKRARSAPPGPRYAPAARLDILRSALRARKMTTDEMRELLEVSRASVYRLLDVLKTTDDLSEDEVAGKKHYRLETNARTHAIRFTLTELIALQVACSMFEMLAGTGLKEDLDEVLARVTATLKRSDVAMAKHLDRKFFFVPTPGRRRYEDRLDDVGDAQEGVLHHHRLLVNFPTKDGKDRSFLFDPYSLLVYKTGLYLAGYSHHHEHVIKLALDAFRAIEWKRGDAFDYPADYHPAKLVEGAFGMIAGEETTVRIRFAKEVVRVVERAIWHPSQRFEARPDGSLDLVMTVRGTTELESWVMSFGATAEVIEPVAMRERVARALEGALAKYR